MSEENIENNDKGNEMTEEEKLELEKVKKEINSKVALSLKGFESEVMQTFNQRVENIGTSCAEKLNKKVSSEKMDVLKVNKIFREICRPIGSRWEELFKELTRDLPEEQTTARLHAVKKSSPIMQSYNALTAWKELRGDSLQLEDLVQALDKMQMDEMKRKVLHILELKSSDELIKLSSSVEEERDKGVTDTRTQHTPSTNKKESIDVPSLNLQDALDDRHLLLLAKKINPVWTQVASEIGVTKAEIDDLMTSQGFTEYQAAFRMLYDWRENNIDNNNNNEENKKNGNKDMLHTLLNALQKFNIPNVGDVFK